MNEMLEQYLRLGLVHFMAFPEVMKNEKILPSTLEKIALDPLFHFIELKKIENPALLKTVKEICTSAGLGIGIAAQPAILGQKLDPGTSNSKLRQKSLDTLKEHIDQAMELGAECVAFLSGPDPVVGQSRREAIARTAGFIVDLCDYCSSYENGGPTLILEIFDREIDKKALIGPAESAAVLCELCYAEGADPDKFGVLVDLSHLPLLDESPMDALEPVEQYLKAAHLGNAVLKEGHPQFGDHHPGFGTAEGANKIEEIRDFINALKNIGFLNRKNPPVVSFEIKPAAGESIDILLACAKRHLMRAWSLS